MQARKPEWEFYDVKANPHEAHNLACSPSHQRTLRDLRMRLERGIEDRNDHGRFREKLEAVSERDRKGLLWPAIDATTLTSGAPANSLSPKLDRMKRCWTFRTSKVEPALKAIYSYTCISFDRVEM